MAENHSVGSAYLDVEARPKGNGRAIGASFGDDFGSGFKGAVSAASVAVGNIISSAVTSAASSVAGEISKTFTNFADYEQLVGGVDTLFKESSSAVQENAKRAFESAGLSANEYMETVTSFSASLISSLDGDTVKAAEVADKAIVDMSDNANKMGSSMESIQNAYQGFAKQNYTMLDNLKLGYGGTKSEMERLLADASELAGVEFNIDSYADVIEAIHVIQESMDITETTAKEGATTISGSINMLHGAWENFLTALGDGGRTMDFGQVTADLMESLGAVAKNAIPTFARIVSSAVTQLPGMIAQAVQGLPGILGEAIAAAFGSDEGLGAVICEHLGDGLADALEGLTAPVEGILEAFGRVRDTLAGTFLGTLESVGVGFSTSLGTPIDAVTGLLNGVLVPALQGVQGFLQSTMLPLVEQFSAFVADEIAPGLSDLAAVVGDVLVAAFETAGTFFQDVWMPAIEAIATFIVDSVVPAIGGLATWALDNLVPALRQVADFITGTVVPAISELGSWISEHLQPVFDGIRAFVLEHVVPAFQQMGDFIMGTVVPDIQELARWVSEHLGPVFEGAKDTVLNHVVPALSDMANFVMDNVVPAIEGMYEWFKENILPVLKDVAEFVADKVLPVFKDIADFICDNVVPALSDLFGWVGDNIVPVFETLAGVLETVVGWLIDVANNIGGAIDAAAAFFFGDGGGSVEVTPASDVAWFASGGIVGKASVVGVGEAGPEAILPLDRLVPLLSEALRTVFQSGSPGSMLSAVVSDWAQGVGEAARDGLSLIPAAFVEAMSEVRSAAEESLAASGEWASTLGSTTGEAFANLSSGAALAAERFSIAFSAIAGAVDSSMEDARNAFDWGLLEMEYVATEGIWDHIIWPAYDTLQALVQAWAMALNDMTRVELPSFDGFGWSNVPSVPGLPGYAEGGFVSSPTALVAGERGTELVWPSYGQALDRYADAIARHMDGKAGGVKVEINNPVIRETADVDRLMEEMNRKLERANVAALH